MTLTCKFQTKRVYSFLASFIEASALSYIGKKDGSQNVQTLITAKLFVSGLEKC